MPMTPTLSTEDTPDEITRFYNFYRNHDEMAESTAKRYRSALRKWAVFCDERDVDLVDPDPRRVEDFLLVYMSDYAPKTRSNARAALSKFFSRAGDRSTDTTPLDQADVGSWTAESVKSEDTSQDIHYLSREQANALVDNVPAPTLRNELICRLMLQTGMRASEVSTIRLEHIDREERRILVLDHKSDDTRVTFFQPSLNTKLNLWLDTERGTVYKADDSDYLFPTTRSEHIHAQRVNTVVREAADNAGIQETYMRTNDESRTIDDADGDTQAPRERHLITSHVLRHTFATHAYDDGDGMDIHIIKEVLGHEDISTTMDLYVHDDEEAIKRGIANHGPVF
jgi:integrase/recombinase XerD